MGKLLDWPPIWTGWCLLGVWGLGRALPFPVFGRAGDIGGGLLVLAGFALMGLAVWEMMQARTTVVPRRVPSALVTSEVFRFSRNPIYLGDSLVLIGACLILDSLAGLILLPLFVWIINTRFIKGEEAALRRDFGNEYKAWSAAVRRWV